MAVRAESIMSLIAAEMVDRGVDVQHQWGKRREERHDRLPRIVWTEIDDDERIEPPWQTRYDNDDGTQSDAFYDRAIKVEATVLAKDETTSETILDVLLAAGRAVLTVSGWEPLRIRKRGERPSSGAHVRILDVVVRLPVLDAALSRGLITTTTLTAVAIEPSTD